jgi:hypothetical protein
MEKFGSGINIPDPQHCCPRCFHTVPLPVTNELYALQDIYQSAEYCHPLLDSSFYHRQSQTFSSAVNCFRCDDRRNFGAGSERFGRQAKSRRLVKGLVSSAIIYIRVGTRPGHFCLEGETTTDRDLDPLRSCTKKKCVFTKNKLRSFRAADGRQSFG